MANSRIPVSSQSGPHRRIGALVERHFEQVWRQPIRAHSQAAFGAIKTHVEQAESLVLDAGCGTGESTARLAEQHPNDLVIGVDKSAARLGRSPTMPDNAILVRAELADFWRLALEAGWRVKRHHLLYPNPWPKPGHVQRRWHAHPVFPSLLGLGGRLELRTNFGIYALEFAQALELAVGSHAKVVSFRPLEPISPFERKYLDSGHDLYRLVVFLEELNQ